jgi:Uma2 family endonuclease
MDSAAFLTWLLRQSDRRRYELIDGRPVEITPGPAETLGRTDAVFALRTAARVAGAACTVFDGGAPVVVNGSTVYHPAIVVGAGGLIETHGVRADAPAVVIEIVGDARRAVDLARKCADYAQTHGVRHILLIDGDRGLVTHHARQANGRFATDFHRAGPILLDPPGLRLHAADLFMTV